VNIHWIHCIENFFTIQHFWTTYTCPEKQRFPWNFSLYWLYTFYHSGFLSNLCLPWKFSLYWIYFLHSGFLSNLRLRWKTEFHCFEIFFIVQEFWATCACPENRICHEIFQDGRRQPPSPPASYAYDTEDENTIFYIAWKMTISKRHE